MGRGKRQKKSKTGEKKKDFLARRREEREGRKGEK
jgi:hypothetical protein